MSKTGQQQGSILVCKSCGQLLKEPYPNTITNALKRIGMYPKKGENGNKCKKQQS